MITEDDLAKAIDRIARTADGALLYAHLQKQLCGVLGTADPTDGALRANHGRRSFAQELMGLMAKGIDESAGRSDDRSGGSGRPSERPVVFAVRQPAVVNRRRSAREWLSDNDPELQHPAGGTGES